MILRLAVACLALSACATSRDVRRLELVVEGLEEVVRDKTATPEDVAEALKEAKAEIREVAEDIDDRPANFMERVASLEGSGVTGLLVTAATVGLHLYRNRQRRIRGEPTKARRGK